MKLIEKEMKKREKFENQFKTNQNKKDEDSEKKGKGRC
jgi:hypothetical protein